MPPSPAPGVTSGWISTLAAWLRLSDSQATSLFVAVAVFLLIIGSQYLFDAGTPQTADERARLHRIEKERQLRRRKLHERITTLVQSHHTKAATEPIDLPVLSDDSDLSTDDDTLKTQ